MCGIAGELNLAGGPDPADVAGVAHALAHRGPDGRGAWSDALCALGHVRLAVIDPSPEASQPLGNEDGSVQVTYNGEIYNFRVLRRRLEGLGHRFRSRCDTEVLVHGWESWGPALCNEIHGAFAFAAWDARARRLFLARDRTGKKPLYYWTDGRRLVFASEIQGLLAHPAVPRRPDPRGILEYLCWGYVPAPHTAFQGIRKLPPATSLSVDARSDRLAFSEFRYWRIPRDPEAGLSEGDATVAVREAVSAAVVDRLVSDVPLGAFLSGGIDSSIVAGVMAQHSGERLRTFTIGFDRPALDERPHARRIAERWHTDHHETVLGPTALDCLPRLVRHYGEPFADSSAVPTYHLGELTRRRVTVALNGDGGDEAFGGYDRYRGAALGERLDAVIGLSRVATALGRRLPRGPGAPGPVRRAGRFLAALSQPAPLRYAAWLSYFPRRERERLLRPEISDAGADPELGAALAWAEWKGLPAGERAMRVDLEGYLPFDLLVKVDIATMAWGLEARSPFLDTRVLELAARLPPALKLRGNQGKVILRRAFADLLPPRNERRPKRGFAAPVADWLQGPLQPLLRDTLLGAESPLRQWLQPREMARLLAEHLSGWADYSFQLWNLLMLRLWHDEVLAGPPHHAGPARGSRENTAGGGRS